MSALPYKASTLPQLLVGLWRHQPEVIAQRHKCLGIWRAYTWREVGEQVLRMAGGLRTLGVQPGDTVAVIGDNEPQAFWIELAAHCVGAKTVSIYPDISPQELAYICDDADVRFIVAQDQEQVDKCISLNSRSTLLGIAYWEPAGLWGYEEPLLKSLDELAALADGNSRLRDEVMAEIAAARGDSIALLSYTSGTTGRPKGTIYTHTFLLDNVERVREGLGIQSGDEYLSYVPLAWGTEQFFGVAMGLVAPLVVNFPERPDTVPENLRELAVHVLFFGARQWEGLARTVQSKMLDAPLWQQRIFNLALKVAEKLLAAEEAAPLTGTQKAKRALAQWVALNGVKAQLGLSRNRVAFVGGAAMAPDVFRFFHALGVSIRNIYGASELGLVTAQLTSSVGECHTIGWPLKVDPSFGSCMEVKLDAEGQILVRGGTGFCGYWKRPEESLAKMVDGWFQTGDVASNPDGRNLVYIDRLNEMKILGSGYRFSPQFIETRLRFSPFVKDVLVLGDEHRDFPAALVNIDAEAVGRWAESRRIPFSGFADLGQRPEVVELIKAEIMRVNELLDPNSHVRRFANLPKELDADDGELTRTRKLRRDVIEQRYLRLIESLYRGDLSVRIDVEMVLQDGRRQKFDADVKLGSLYD